MTRCAWLLLALVLSCSSKSDDIGASQEGSPASGGAAGTGGAPSAASGGAGPIQVGGSGGSAVPPGYGICSSSEDLAFATLGITRVLGVWGPADDDIHVAFGDNQHEALAHYDGAAWAVTNLTDPPYIKAMSWTSSTDIWRLGAADEYGKSPTVLHTGGTSTPLAYPYAFDIAGLGPDDVLVAASPTETVGQGVVVRLSAGQWVPMPLPDLGSPYTIVKLIKLDATHVYGLGRSLPKDSPMTAVDVLAAFDGTAWTALRLPVGFEGAGSPPSIEDIAVAAPDRIYAFVDLSATRGLYRVSADLTTWTLLHVAEPTYTFDGLGVTRAGTVVLVSDTLAPPVGQRFTLVTMIRDGEAGSACGVGTGTTAPVILSASVAFSAPGSPNVHIFGTRHYVVRVDP